MSREDGRLVYVMFDGAHPARGIIRHDRIEVDQELWFNYDRRYDFLQYTETSSGRMDVIRISQGETFWIADGVDFHISETSRLIVDGARPETVRLEAMPAPYTPETLLEIAEEFHGSFLPCVVCGEDYPEDDFCEHIFWSDADGWYMGSGYLEHGSDAGKEAVVALLAAVGPEGAQKVAEVLRSEEIEFTYRTDSGYLVGEPLTNGWNEVAHPFPDPYGDEPASEDFDEDAVAVGMAFLGTLKAGKTKEATDRVLQWIVEYLEGAEAAAPAAT